MYLHCLFLYTQDTVPGAAENLSGNEKDQEKSSKSKLVVESKFGVKKASNLLKTPEFFSSDDFDDTQNELLPRFMVRLTLIYCMKII